MVFVMTGLAQITVSLAQLLCVRKSAKELALSNSKNGHVHTQRVYVKINGGCLINSSMYKALVYYVCPLE